MMSEVSKENENMFSLMKEVIFDNKSYQNHLEGMIEEKIRGIEDRLSLIEDKIDKFKDNCFNQKVSIEKYFREIERNCSEDIRKLEIQLSENKASHGIEIKWLSILFITLISAISSIITSVLSRLIFHNH